MRSTLLALAWTLVLVTSVSAQGVGPAPGIELRDEGAVQGRVQKVDCVGSSIACTKSGVTGTITITGGGGTITVQAADGTPSYSGISTIQFDEADGFVITNPSAGVAQIDSTGGGGGLSHPQVMSRMSVGF